MVIIVDSSPSFRSRESIVVTDLRYASLSLQVIEVRTPPYRKLDDGLNAGAYLQWRPVSYNSALREVTSSTETVQYPPKMSNRTSEVENTMIYRYYGRKVDNLLLQRLTVSLGSQGDGFYKKTNYLTW